MGHIVSDIGLVVGVTLESCVESLGHVLLDIVTWVGSLEHILFGDGTWVESLGQRPGHRLSQGDSGWVTF